MDTSNKTWGWELAKNGAWLAVILGAYPSFHDSAVRSFCMRRCRQTSEGLDGQSLAGGSTRELVDIQLEVLHNRYGAPPVAGRPDHVVVLDCLDVRTSEIDANAMLEEATIMDMSLSETPGGLIALDLVPNVGLDIRLTCKEVVVSEVRPYNRDNA
ncbi:hypothetical protein RI103_23115 [Paraburkholderia sp. FT54]|uniref:hypothetical protein n=1 Tax=Paraburkholderia sp. FT54 TaxID=3074437 RepID=UPI002877E1E0|nr:hypothetical protein [Paraburkholderia sp. FT54]WNC93681.1 hypothetical protein RI103_23115 [Paraburkholderia sp. FT54]